MLHAILKGKIANPAIEDSLSSGVFRRLMYLGEDLLWTILCKTIVPSDILPDCAVGVDYDNSEFWPYWWMRESLSEGRKVEPDFLLCFNDFDLIVEAKRWDSISQYADQLAREWLAYYDQTPKARAYLCAVGGLGNATNEVIKSLQDEVNRRVQLMRPGAQQAILVGMSWRKLYASINALRAGGELAGHENAILDDIREVLRLHNIEYREPEWFGDFPQKASVLGGIRSESLSFYMDQKRYQPNRNDSYSEYWWREGQAFRPIRNASIDFFQRRLI
jgi:hypothetical protein